MPTFEKGRWGPQVFWDSPDECPLLQPLIGYLMQGFIVDFPYSSLTPYTLAARESLLLQANTVAPMYLDMLNTLPPELRSQLYPYVFSTRDEGRIVLQAMWKGDWAGDMGLPPYATLLHNPRYDRYRRRRKTPDKWPSFVEEAFHKRDTKN